jgi:hypothetical protein
LIKTAEYFDADNPPSIRLAAMDLRHQRLKGTAVLLLIKSRRGNIDKVNLMIAIPLPKPIDFSPAERAVTVEEHLELIG